MKRESRARRWLRAFSHWGVFFLLAAFVITCCMTLFVSTMSYSMGLTFSEADIQQAAKLTFMNVVFLSLLFTVIDALRRWLTVKRPVQKIIEAAEKMVQGDFSVRVPPVKSGTVDEDFNRVIDCFNKMAGELSGIETLRTDFIANVSHELKTPLAVMQNYGTLLQQPGLSDEKRIEYAKSVSEASRRLADLISNILRLNKLENQQIHLLNETFDLGEQLCECLLGFESRWEQKELEIETDIQDGVMIKSDPELLSLIWNNLFSNAVKFTPQGGRISLVLAADDETATVSVADTGCGIAPEVGQHIFEKFYQGDSSHSTQGNGLGLALVKRVVDITGGGISVESEPGRGSIFTVTLKRGEQHGSEAASE